MGESLEKIFTKIYNYNRESLTGSPSGPGSDLENTRVLQAQLPILFRQLEISSLLDIPCGDFNWMRLVNLGGITYLGADIVQEIVEVNQMRFAGETISFSHMDLIEDQLPVVDLILCRDCLVHFSFKDGIKALRNIVLSGSIYLLTTHFPDHKENRDIPTGNWRPLNLELAPYNLPTPLDIINEGYTGNGGRFRDKSLALWDIDAIRQTLADHSV